ncbi:inositol monophosphatase family protein [Streptomyces griseoaurantiacus]|uniref:inositol monophosphatase family protein n=1 Tax=Streptomyces griseoaurantiacus TaxID=68213 RepID=UPI0030E4E792
MFDPHTSEGDAAVAAAGARAGADVVRARYGRRLRRIGKGGGDFATDADVAAERAILDVIRFVRPEDAVLGEEGGRRGTAYVTDGENLSGIVYFAAGIALCRAAGCVVTGVEGAPLDEGGRGLMVAADEETHALLMSMTGGSRGR